MWRYILRFYHDKALIYADSPECNAWSMWFAPGGEVFSIPRFLLSGGIRMSLRLGIPTVLRMMNYEQYCNSVRMKSTGGDGWYLYNLVVSRKFQNCHLSSRLILPMLSYAESQNKPVYLETHSSRNVGIYQHFGFKVVSDNPIPGTNVTHWGMLYNGH